MFSGRERISLGSRALESHLLGERSNEPEESADAEKSVAVSWRTEKPIKNRTDHLNYGHSHQKLRRLGWGWAPNPQTCQVCNGTGKIKQVVTTPFGQMSTQKVCSNCGGEGKIIKEPCSVCKGKGTVRESAKIKVKIPEGISDGYLLCYLYLCLKMLHLLL